MYNPLQNRMESLMQQRQMIENQMQALQQYQNVPPININNNMQPNQVPFGNSFDFNGKWVQNEQEAKGIANNNLPLILFDQNEPVFYMKNMDGSFKKFRFEEMKEQPQANPSNERMDMIEGKLNALIDTLTKTGVNTNQQQETLPEAPKIAQNGKLRGNK